MPHKAYGRMHQLKRKALLPYAYGKACPICGKPMTADQQLDLDHSNPIDKQLGKPGDRITHRTCNRGGIFGNATDANLGTTREW